MALPASSQVPDEIIKEILAPALYVSDEAFSNTSLHANPFAKYELSTSTILVVCKSWLRVATPLLYETVVLRSKAQAQALASALKRNEQLGRFVRKLRVEGGYGTFVGEILRRSPSLTELWISTALYSNESVAGYLKGFKSVNPRRLIVVDDRLKTSAIRKKAYEALGEAIRHTWTNLILFEVSGGRDWADRVVPLVDGLREASHLQSLCFHSDCPLNEPIARVVYTPSLKLIRLKNSYGKKPSFESLKEARYLNGLEMLMRNDRKVYDKVVYEKPNEQKDGGFYRDFGAWFEDEDDEDTSRWGPGPQKTMQTEDTDIVAAPLDPNWKPLAALSDEDRRKIISAILCHAASLSEHGTSTVLTSTAESLQQFRAGLTLVSREYNELATPFLYEAPTLLSHNSLKELSRTRHSHHIKYLWLRYGAFGSSDPDIDREALTLVLLSRCSNLVLVSEAQPRFTLDALSKDTKGLELMAYQWSRFESKMSIRPSTLAALSRNCASTLRHLHLSVKFTSFESQRDFTRALHVLGQLQELRSIIVCGEDGEGDLDIVDASAAKFPADAFPYLERMVVDPSNTVARFFLYALCSSKLPALNWLQIEDESCVIRLDTSMDAFLSTHGDKLTYLKTTASLGSLFSYCCNVETWHAVWWENISVFGCLDASNLKLAPDFEYALSSIFVQSHGFSPVEAEVLLDTDLHRLTKLKEIHVNQLQWPTSQRDIEKSPWVKVAEAMVEEWNVKFADRKGTAWVPRLKPSRKK
ncbi:hypothetical protein BKA70DRAFT_1278178 [Coprinopsis sp. MPI-PUGE-AT-0042]|nr:hypothetical protein BKA70DRAFT_1278178 [Coprinopsis sp. MPI-PUGE-AT-0042]